MKQKSYEAPTTRVVNVQHPTALLQASSSTSSVKDYEWHKYEEE